MRSSVEPVVQLGEQALEVLLALGRLRVDELLDLGVALRVHDREREVLELPLHVADAEPVRERRVDVERLLGDAQLLRLGQRRDRAHVVEPVGELDEQDPDVLGHRDEHLAQRRGLLGLLGVELEPVQLGDAVDDRGDVRRRSRARCRRGCVAVSSTASWSSAAAMVTSSRPRSARIIATPTGWEMYGSPERRTCSAWARQATR